MTNGPSGFQTCRRSRFVVCPLSSDLRFSFRSLRVLVLAFSALASSLFPVQAQRAVDRSPPVSPAEAEREARTIVSEMLAQKPDRNSTNAGSFKIRDEENNKGEFPVDIITYLTPTNWVQVYEARPRQGNGASLTIIHTLGKQNLYLLKELGQTNTPAKELSGNQTMFPFAGTDFWIADLGYEFLHWPNQRLLKKQMRNSKFCAVLESVNPNPESNAYSRVVSWITV